MATNCDDEPTGALVSIGGDIPPPVNVPGVGPVQELACDDIPGGPVTPAFEDTPDCRCATRRLCEFDDGPWWEVCEQGGICKWRPLLDVLFQNATVDQTTTICQWIIDNCGGELTTLINTTVGVQITNAIDTFKTTLFSHQTYPVADGPDCADATTCVTWFAPDDSVDADCPNGVATHVCIDGDLVCLGGDGGGPGGGADDTQIVPTAWSYGPSFVSPGFDCDIPFTGGLMSAAHLAALTGASGLCAAALAPPASISSDNVMGGEVNHISGDLKFCFDVSGVGAAVNFHVVLVDSGGTALTPVSQAGTGGATAAGSTYNPADCNQTSVQVTAPASGGNVCIDYGALSAGTYDLQFMGLLNFGPTQTECVANLTFGVP